MKLTSLYLFAKNVRSLLRTYHYQQLFLHEFSMAYSKYVGETVQPKAYGFSSVEELLGAIPQVGVSELGESSWRATTYSPEQNKETAGILNRSLHNIQFV